MVSVICAVCENGQVDINSASLEKLDELDGIGPVKAQAIIDARVFDSVDDLINVKGIGPVTFEKIKDVACVDREKEQKEDVKEDEPSSSIFPNVIEQQEYIPNQENKVELETIKLNAPEPKDIKSEEDKKILDKSDWAKYGFVGFCVLLVFLFILKKPKIQEID